MRLDGILIAMQKLVVDFCTDKFTDIIKNYTTVVIDMQVQLDPIFIALAKKPGTNEYEPQ